MIDVIYYFFGSKKLIDQGYQANQLIAISGNSYPVSKKF